MKIIDTNYRKSISLVRTLCLIAISLLGIYFANAKDINFNAKYGTGGNVAANITRAINEAAPGDRILFNSETYNLNGRNITISKRVILKGLNPIGFNANATGASGIRTTFNNCGNIFFRSNGIKVRDLSLKRQEGRVTVLVDFRHTTYGNRNVNQNQWYTGIEFNNVALSGASYNVHAGNGMGGTFTNVSFSGFKNHGFWFNRQGRVNSHPKIVWDKCLFKSPPTGIRFSNRGISIDAGNEEYPVVWNHNNSIVQNSRFVNTGIGASSRGHSVIVKNNIFDDNAGNVDMIHVEEFSYNIKIEGNKFNCNSNRGSKIIVLDRNAQVVKDIKIKNNTITGKYRFFISTYAPNNVTITGNNFNAANSVTGTCMNFTFYEGENRGDPIPFPFVSDGIVIRDNPGLNLTKNGKLIINVKKTGANNVIQDFNSNRQIIKKIDPPKSIVSNGTYEIVNVATNKKLSAGTGNRLVTKAGSDNFVRWKVTFIPPHAYSIQNMGNSKYLEVTQTYTESDIFNNKPQNKFPFLQNTYAGRSVRPFFTVIKKGANFEVHPGGNERQSAIATNGREVKLVFSKKKVDTHLEPKSLGSSAKWKFQRVSDKTTTDLINKDSSKTPIQLDNNSDKIIIFPNPVKENVNITGIEKGDIIAIYDILGQQVINTIATNDQESISTLSLEPGMYVLSIMGKSKIQFIKD